MRDSLHQRLLELRQEYEAGVAKARELESQQKLLRETMLRISGAIQVLEEMLAHEGAAGEDDNGSESATVIAMPAEAARLKR